ncbi:MAG: hypothetical protein COA88_09515 [Kordia sp.]|nr:MAG: hypothetical protein COA88_09515 [Kordia sp.]
MEEILISIHESFLALIKNDIIKIISGGLIGASISVLIQWKIRINKRLKIKKVISSFLLEIVLIQLSEIEKEIIIVRDNVKTYNSIGLSLSTYPSLNSKILNSFPIEEIRYIYEDKFTDFIDIISFIDGIEHRTPYITWNKFIVDTSDHINDSDKTKCSFKDNEAHYNRCSFIISKLKVYNANLVHLEKMISKLKLKIETVTDQKRSSKTSKHYLFFNDFIKSSSI